MTIIEHVSLFYEHKWQSLQSSWHSKVAFTAVTLLVLYAACRSPAFTSQISRQTICNYSLKSARQRLACVQEIRAFKTAAMRVRVCVCVDNNFVSRTQPLGKRRQTNSPVGTLAGHSLCHKHLGPSRQMLFSTWRGQRKKKKKKRSTLPDFYWTLAKKQTKKPRTIWKRHLKRMSCCCVWCKDVKCGSSA